MMMFKRKQGRFFFTTLFNVCFVIIFSLIGNGREWMLKISAETHTVDPIDVRTPRFALL